MAEKTHSHPSCSHKTEQVLLHGTLHFSSFVDSEQD